MGYLQLQKHWYTPAEIGRLAGVSRQTVIKWIGERRLPATRTPGGHWRIPADVVRGVEPTERVQVRAHGGN